MGTRSIPQGQLVRDLKGNVDPQSNQPNGVHVNLFDENEAVSTGFMVQKNSEVIHTIGYISSIKKVQVKTRIWFSETKVSLSSLVKFI